MFEAAKSLSTIRAEVSLTLILEILIDSRSHLSQY
jgi:hypothetical protein